MTIDITGRPPRIIAPGGPVSRALAVGRGEYVAEQRDIIRSPSRRIRAGIAESAALFDSVERAAGRLFAGGAA